MRDLPRAGKLTRVSFVLDGAQLRRIALLARRSKRSRSVVIRSAVDYGLAIEEQRATA